MPFDADMERRQFEEVMVINKPHWERHGRLVSAETVRHSFESAQTERAR
jgi:hypothetical protein